MFLKEVEETKQILGEKLQGLSKLKETFTVQVLPRALHLSFPKVGLEISLKWFQSGENIHRKILVESKNASYPTLIHREKKYSSPEDMVKTVLNYVLMVFVMDLYASEGGTCQENVRKARSLKTSLRIMDMPKTNTISSLG